MAALEQREITRSGWQTFSEYVSDGNKNALCIYVKWITGKWCLSQRLYCTAQIHADQKRRD